MQSNLLTFSVGKIAIPTTSNWNN